MNLLEQTVLATLLNALPGVKAVVARVCPPSFFNPEDHFSTDADSQLMRS
jgi:hypothetical protein